MPENTADAPLDRVARIQAEWRRERPDVDPWPQGIIGRLHRLADYLREEIGEVYEQYGLGEGEFDVLAALRRAGAPFMRAPGELADHTMVTSGAMTKRVDRLEKRGLVTRRVSEVDGRARVIALTPEGRDLVDRVFTAHMRNEHRLLEVLSDADAAAIEGVLARWLAAVEKG